MNPGAQWTVYRTRFLVRAQQLTAPLIFTDALGREQSGRPGDYLVESSDGLKRITTQALFEDIYVPVQTPTSVLQNTTSRAPTNNGALHSQARPPRASPEVRARATA